MFIFATTDVWLDALRTQGVRSRLTAVSAIHEVDIRMTVSPTSATKDTGIARRQPVLSVRSRWHRPARLSDSRHSASIYEESVRRAQCPAASGARALVTVAAERAEHEVICSSEFGVVDANLPA